MDITSAAQYETSMLKKSIDQESLGAQVITSTLDKLNTGMRGMTPVVNPDYDMQKTVLSAAYADKGIGTRLNTVA